MSDLDLSAYLWLIPALPLAASALIALIAFFAPANVQRNSHWPCILAGAGSFFLSFMVLLAMADRFEGEVSRYYTWFAAGEVNVGLTLRADGLSSFMLVTVTFIATLIAIYSAGYMHGDPGYPRYFAEVSLFIAAMTLLVLADNFLVLYAGWEGVGLCSYLLVGFWYAKPSAADAARKAFLVTRLGDVGLLVGIIVLWLGSGYRLDYDGVFSNMDPALLTTACLLLFCGAVGKSAQFPLHVWLPDAMEGPSPVSALIHAATMVTAGVYLVARCTPLFIQAPEAQLVVGCIGGFTALLASLIALTQNDLKRVLAYSTVSQLGYMFLALGSGTSETLVTAAVVAAIFHLFTHAFFKALLFLSAGSVMHAMGNVIDMRRFSGLRHVLPVTHWTFLCGALALAAIFPFAGFWSKDEILGAALHAGESGPSYRGVYLVLFAAGLITAGLTGFYTFRGYFLTFWGEKRIPPEAGEHAHESPPVMLVPLMILAVGAFAVGFVFGPTQWLSRLLAGRELTRGLQLPEHPHAPDLVLMLGSSLVALAGIGVAWWMYVRQPGIAGRLAASFPGLYQLSLNKFYLDELFTVFLVKPLEGLAQLSRVFDLHLIDGLVDLIGQLPRWLGQVFRPVQNGLVQFYALAMVLGLTVFLVALARTLLVAP
jgi:NADH-quinone oxidoreductase subunit L